MILLGSVFVIICALLIMDYALNKDLLSPYLLIVGNILALFFLPALIKYVSIDDISYVPTDYDHSIIIQFTTLFLFLNILVFSVSYFVSQHLFKETKLPKFKIEFKSRNHFFINLFLSFGSSIILLILFPYTIWGDGAYYFMAGFGHFLWISNILLFMSCFLFLDVPKHRFWTYPGLFLFILVMGVLLERGTQLGFLVICSLIVLRESFRISKNIQFLFIVLVPVFLIVFKFLSYLAIPQPISESIMTFIKYDLGRFDFLANAMHVKLEGLSLDPMTILRYIPFANYLPYIQNLNLEFQELPEKLMLGKRVSIAAGLPFTGFGDQALLIGLNWMLFMHAIWGVVFGFLYSITKNSGNSYLLGFYAVFLYSARGLGFSGIITIFSMIIFIVFFCNIIFEEYNLKKNAS